MVESYMSCNYTLNQRYWDELLPAAKFAYNPSVSKDFETGSFEMYFSWTPKAGLDQLSKYESIIERMRNFNLRFA